MTRLEKRATIGAGPRAAAAALAAAVFLLVSTAQAKTDIKVDYDKKFSFATLRTWSWHPEGRGDVRIAVSSEDDPKAIAARVDPVIIPAVERELTARGFTSAAAADFYVHYYVLATLKQEAQYAGQFLPSVPEWGIPPFTASTTSLSMYPVGTLVIDVTSPPGGPIVWRGAAQRTINIERPDDERRKVLEQAIRDLIRRIPKK
jgi:Domain of unknown function (DUF4136)